MADVVAKVSCSAQEVTAIKGVCLNYLNYTFVGVRVEEVTAKSVGEGSDSKSEG